MTPTSLLDNNADTARTDSSLQQWLKAHRSRSSLFCSPTLALMAHGQALVCRGSNANNDLDAQATQLLTQAHEQGLPSLLMGVLPFNTTQPAHLFVPHSVLRSAPLQPSAATTPQPHPAATLQPFPDGAGYADMVGRSLPLLDDQPLSKIVLARTMDVALEQPLQRQQLLHNLIRLNPHGYNFGINLDDQEGDNPCFFGASPELLVRRSGSQVSVNPLAGTAARVADPEADARIGQALLQSAKDLHEHAIVIESVVQALRPFCTSLHVPDGPELAKTATLWHLSTPIHGTLRAPYASSLELALAMHPTPAVCGTPTLTARDMIETLEPFERQFYAGAAGWCDDKGDGEWAVAIRCGLYQEQRIRLYAGAGIVAASDPDSERRETGNKLRTMLNALNIEPATIEGGITL
ncbi:isochorismate synthase MenF [Paenalcaligenes sp. Me131]|uniref:isochorismate synthase n=1 Tax=Paenalcaligenes sp. Me131 TaxID=3392636 RepID=UPI003D2CA049